MSEPPQKKTRAESQEASSSPAVQTIFVTCKHIHSRGELVNAFFYNHREELGLGKLGDNWYPCEGRLNRDAPLEIVHVKNSKRPYFLVEWRYPTQAELERRKVHDHADGTEGKNGDEKDDQEGGDGAEAAPVKPQSNEDLAGYAARLLTLGHDSGDALTHKEAPVTITAATAGTTVASERTKLALRDEERKRASAEASAKGLPSAHAGGVKSLPPTPATTTTFVPRTVRRR